MGGRSDFDGKATTDIRLAFDGAPVGSLPVCTNWCSRLTCLAVLLSVGAVACNQAPSGTNRSTASADPEKAPAAASEVSPAHVVDHEVRLAAHPVAQGDSSKPTSSFTVPAWAADAVFYQIFPERFANGDKSNDPTRESLEVARIGAQELDDFAVDRRLVRPRRLGERAAGRTSSRTACSIAATAAICRACSTSSITCRALGINTIYFNPVFYARSLHKYDGNSFHHVDPYFGPDPAGDFALMAQGDERPATWHWTAADKLFLELLRQAHAREMRVIIDGVFNHTGRDFFAFADLRQQQAESPYRDWYIVQSFDDPATPQNEFRYKGWWGVDTLPEFADNDAGNDLHAGPKQYVFDSTKRWMDPNGDGDPADGIDGWRLDVANEVPTGFWRDWHALARKINPECYTVAEIWDDARQFLDDGGFSATMNYHGFAFPVKGFLIDEVLPPSGAALRVERAAQRLSAADAVRAAEPDRFARHRSAGVDDRQRRPAAVRAAGPVRLRHQASRRGTCRITTCASRTTASGACSGWSRCCR